MVFLPFTVAVLRQYRLLVVFVGYTIVLDFYFLSTNRDVMALVKFGPDGCVDVEQAVNQLEGNPFAGGRAAFFS